MQRLHFEALAPALRLKHVSRVDDALERVRLLGEAQEAEAASVEALCELSSSKGKVVAWRLTSGDVIICEGKIKLLTDGSPADQWVKDAGPSVYTVNADDTGMVTDPAAAIEADAERLFLSHSLHARAAERVTGWQGNIIALIPDRADAPQPTVMRTRVHRGIEVVRTRDMDNAYSTYIGWVEELARVLGGDDAMGREGEEKPAPPSVGSVGHIAQAWLTREAADAQLAQARASLKLGLGGHARFSTATGSPLVSVARLARSLHTDRPNLSKMWSAAENDHRILQVLDTIKFGGHEALPGEYGGR